MQDRGGGPGRLWVMGSPERLERTMERDEAGRSDHKRLMHHDEGLRPDPEGVGSTSDPGGAGSAKGLGVGGGSGTRSD